MRSLQTLQNKVARVVTKLDWSTPTRDLLHQCGWLSVNQLAYYHSVLLMYKVKVNHTTRYLDSMFIWNYNASTRQATTGQIRQIGKPRLDIAKNSFRWRAASQFNLLPMNIRNSENLGTFKIQAKMWIKTNVSLW